METNNGAHILKLFESLLLKSDVTKKANHASYTERSCSSINKALLQQATLLNKRIKNNTIKSDAMQQ